MSTLSTFHCFRCLTEIRAYYNHQQDPTRRFQPWTTRCGHVFHRKCLEESVQWQQALGSVPGGVEPDSSSLNPEFEANCPACSQKFTLQSSVPLFPVVRIPTAELTTSSPQPPEVLLRTCQVTAGVQVHSPMESGGVPSEADQVRSLQLHVEKLQDANGALGLLLIHNEAELEKYTTKLEEFRADLLGIVRKVDQLLAGIGNKPERAQPGTSDVLLPTSGNSIIPDVEVRGTSTTTGVHPGSPGSVSWMSQAEGQQRLVVSGEILDLPEIGRTRRPGTSSSNPSISTNTVNSFRTAPSSSSSHCSISSVRSISSSRNGGGGPGGGSNPLRQSHPTLPGSTATGAEPRRRRNTVWDFFVTSFINPGRVRDQ